jgi:mRNA-degrading endonuclease RelE of RelBE toxin-antitoxin system
MRQIIALPSFLRSTRRLSHPDKSQLAESLEQFNNFIVRGELPIGLGFRKIGQDKCEFRVGLRLRMVVKAEGDVYYLVSVGSHDEVRRYLRKYR